MKRWNMAGRMALLIAGMTLLLTGCGGAFDPKGTNAEEQFFLIALSFFVMAAVMAVVFGLFFYVLIRFRKKKGQTGYPEQIEGSHKLEVIWTLIPFILIMILSVFVVSITFKQDKVANAEDAVNVKVVAHQFWCEFVYSDYSITTAQDLVLPANSNINVELTSDDVMHSFWIPQLTGKMDTNPGLKKTLTFDSGEPDVYKGKCAELCGASHALMDFKAVVVSEEEFEAWVEKMKAPAPVAASETTQAGEQLYQANCIACHAVTTDTPGAGPNLAGFASRETLAGFRENNKEWLKEWISNPQEVKPGATMPAFGAAFNDAELDSLVEYLQTLK